MAGDSSLQEGLKEMEEIYRVNLELQSWSKQPELRMVKILITVAVRIWSEPWPNHLVIEFTESFQ